MTITKPLRSIAEVRVSNVDKKTAVGERLVRLCNYTDVYYRDVITADLDLMGASATEAQIRSFELRAGDTVITKDSETADDIGIGAFVPVDLKNVVCGYHLAILRPTPSAIDPGYFSWATRSDFVRGQLEVKATGVTRYGLTYGAIKGLDLPIAANSLDEQRRISAFLDDQVARIDQAIALRGRQIELSAVQLSCWLDDTIRQAVSRVGTIPLRRVVFGIEQGGSPIADNYPAEEGGYGVLKTSSIKLGRFIESENKALIDESLIRKELPVHSGDVLIVRGSGSADLVADAALVRDEPKSRLLLSDLIYRLRNPKRNPDFLVMVLVAPSTRQVIRALVRQGSGPAKVRGEDILGLPVPAVADPAAVEMADEYWRERAASEASVGALTRSAALLLERKRSLITAAVTGEFDVSSASTRALAGVTA